MALYPLDLVLTVALAWGTIFLGALPTRLLRLPVFARPALFAGLGWLAVALVSPAAVRHFYFFIALACFFAGWKLGRDEALRGKTWLAVVSGLGIGSGPVLILTVTPGACPAGWVRPAELLLPLYLGGAVIGLGAVLYLFTRREATRSGLPVGWVFDYARLLFLLALARSAWGIAGPLLFFRGGGTLPVVLLLLWLLLPASAWLALQRARSPAPSTSGGPLLILCVVGLVAEILTG